MALMTLERFWWLLMIAVVVWYSTVTIYIAVRGTLDVQHMLRALGEKQSGESGPPNEGP
jgi:hypothetical protein